MQAYILFMKTCPVNGSHSENYRVVKFDWLVDASSAKEEELIEFSAFISNTAKEWFAGSKDVCGINPYISGISKI